MGTKSYSRNYLPVVKAVDSETHMKKSDNQRTLLVIGGLGSRFGFGIVLALSHLL